MPRPPSFGKIGIGLTSGEEPASFGTRPETPFRILVLGDFSGRGAAGEGDLGGRRPVFVDRDNFEEVLAKTAPTVHLALGDGAAVTVRFRELDDFHPDRLFQRLEGFQALRELRERLANSSTFAAAAAEMQGWGTTRADAKAGERPAASRPSTDPASLLAEMLGEAPAETEQARGPVARDDIQAFLRQSVAGHVIPDLDEARQAELVALVDEATSRQMRAVLHHPEFQALESAWRSLFFLVRRLDTDTKLKLYFLDVAQTALASDLTATDDLQRTGLYRLLVEQTVGTPGGQPWAVVTGLYAFGPAREDAEVLGRVAQVAQLAGAPFLAGASDALLGCAALYRTPDPDDWQEPADAEGAAAWQALRQLPEATLLGLALPRFLLRLPYDRENNPIEAFALEEMAETPEHAAYLWGNAAVVCACLLGEAFSRHEWDLQPGSVRELAGLPLHVYRADGESKLQPCTEVLLGERALEAVLERGPIALAALENRDAVQVPRFQSLAEPAAALAGRWHRSPD